MLSRILLSITLLLLPITAMHARYTPTTMTQQEAQSRACGIATAAIANLFNRSTLDSESRQKLDDFVTDFNKANFTPTTDYRQMTDAAITRMVIEQSLQWVCKQAMNLATILATSVDLYRPYFTGANQSELQPLRLAVHKALLAQTERVRVKPTIYVGDLRDFIGTELRTRVANVLTEIVNRDCAIPYCSGQGKAQLKPCGHKLHADCQNQLQTQKCPLCSDSLTQSEPQVVYTQAPSQPQAVYHNTPPINPAYTQQPQTSTTTQHGLWSALLDAIFGSSTTSTTQPTNNYAQERATRFAKTQIKRLFYYHRLEYDARKKLDTFIADFCSSAFKLDTDYSQMTDAAITRLVLEESLQWVCMQATNIAKKLATNDERFRPYFTGANQSEQKALFAAIHKAILVQTERLRKQRTILEGELFEFTGTRLEQRVIAQMIEIVNRDCAVPYCDGRGKAKLLPCGHKLHDDCLRSLNSPVCPLCRDSIAQEREHARAYFNL